MAKEYLVAVDVGNTACKFGLFPNAATGMQTKPLKFWRLTAKELTEKNPACLENELGEFQDAKCTLVTASVNKPAEEQLAKLWQTRRPQDEIRSLRFSDFPLILGIDSPETVGLDRLACALGALEWLKQDTTSGDVIIVDTGTAITVDRVTRDGVFEGGAIFPGLQMQFASLAARTNQLPEAKLPSLNDDTSIPFIGKNTTAAIQTGVFWGVIGAINKQVANMTGRDAVHVVITGGDAPRLRIELQRQCTHLLHLALRGIALAVT